MKKIFLHTILNAVIYTLIAVALFYLYSPLNTHPANKPSSSITFVYQQF